MVWQGQCCGTGCGSLLGGQVSCGIHCSSVSLGVLSSFVGSAWETVQTHYLHCLQFSIPAKATPGKDPLSWEHMMEASLEQNVAGLDFPSSHAWGCGENFICTADFPSPHVAACGGRGGSSVGSCSVLPGFRTPLIMLVMCSWTTQFWYSCLRTQPKWLYFFSSISRTEPIHLQVFMCSALMTSTEQDWLLLGMAPACWLMGWKVLVWGYAEEIEANKVSLILQTLKPRKPSCEHPETISGV